MEQNVVRVFQRFQLKLKPLKKIDQLQVELAFEGVLKTVQCLTLYTKQHV